LAEHGVSTAEIAAAAQCHISIVQKVIQRKPIYDTPNSKRVQQTIATRLGKTVAELWPPDEPVSETRTTAGSGR